MKNFLFISLLLFSKPIFAEEKAAFGAPAATKAEEDTASIFFDAIYEGDISRIMLLVEECNSYVKRLPAPLNCPAMNDELRELTAQLFIERDACMNPRDKRGNTPLHLASLLENLKIAKLLVEGGAMVNVRNKSDETPLHKASVAGALEIAKFLIEKHAYVDAKNSYGRTPLHNASTYGKLESAELLIEKKANVNTKDEHGYTPLHSASRHGDLRMATLLLENDANVNAENTISETPFDVARTDEMEQLLKSYSSSLKK